MSGILCYTVLAVSCAVMFFFGFGAVLINIFDNKPQRRQKIKCLSERLGFKKRGVKSVRR